jgi:hypothetical protein
MRKRVLITVKTYPTLSQKYDELVCTAGFDENGDWIRLFPIPFRKLDYENRYKKYQWIEVDAERNPSDFRPESHRPNIDTLALKERVEADGGAWRSRRALCLKKVFTNKQALLAEAADTTKRTSLAVFKPTEILDFTIEDGQREWDPAKLAALKAHALQTNLFAESENPFEAVSKIPYKFSYRFRDDVGQESTLMVTDWELGMLFRNSLLRHGGDEKRACDDVRRKYLEDFARTKDLHFFLGTTQEHHARNAPNPFLIVGTFHPGFESQQTLL